MSNYTDKELLMLAAKAYGIEVDYRHGSGAFYYDDENTGREEWDPLDDDGQALRLLHKLRLELYIDTKGVSVRTLCGMKTLEQSNEIHATRRAIVRAAAAIGSEL